jgi:urea transporter
MAAETEMKPLGEKLAPPRNTGDKQESVIAYGDWKGQLAPEPEPEADPNPTIAPEPSTGDSIWSTRLDDKSGIRWVWALILKIIRLPNGTMSWLDHWLTKRYNSAKEAKKDGGILAHVYYWFIFFLIFIDAALRSASGAVTCNNPVTGLFVWAGSFSHNRWHSTMTIMAVVITNLTAFALGIGHGPIRSGVFGSSGYLMAALTARVTSPADEWNYRIVLLIMFCAPITVATSLSLGNFLIPKFRLPPLALPSHIPFWTIVLLAIISPNISAVPYPAPLGTVRATQPAQNPGPAATFVDGDLMLRGIFIGIGQMAVQNEVRAGALILGGIFCYSRISAINAVWGTVLSTLIAVAFGMPAAEIANGVWSFQGALVAMTLCGLFYVVTVTTFINAVWAVIFQVLVNAFFRVVFGLIGIPPIALPFTLVVWFFLGMQGSIRGAPPVDLTEISTPERHFKIHWKRKAGRKGTSSMFIRNTGIDPAALL